MRKTISCKVDVCDICNRENVSIKQCILCECDFCSLTCDGYFPDAQIAVPVCKSCAHKHPEIESTVNHYGKQIATIVDERNKQIRLRFRDRNASRFRSPVGAG